MKKTLATLLVLAMVASVVCMMFVVPAAAAVSGEGNLAAGKEWTGDTDIGTSYAGDLTDGVTDPEGHYDDSLWYGADRRKTTDDAFTMIFDLEEVYNNIAEVKAFVWPAGYSGIVVPASIDFYASEDGEEYFELGTITEFETTDPHWVTLTLDSVVTARYIRIDMVASVEGDTGVFWFIGEVEVNAGEAPAADVEPKAPVYADVLDGSVKVPSDEALLKLIDGNLASDATAFGDAGLVAFENTGFTHTDGVEAAVPATVAITADLGAVKTLSKVSLSAYKESGSMIALPEVSFEVSVDGINFYQINAGGTVKPAEDAAESTTATLTADFSTRVAVEARYVRAIASFTNGWIFVSEISATEAEGYTAVDPSTAFAFTYGTVPSPGIGIYTIEDGELDLSTNDGQTGKLFRNAQLIHAVYDAEKDAYKVLYSKVNPWPDGHSGLVTMGENEILLAISTGGALVAETDDATITSNLFSGCKWIARGLTEGDYLVIDEDAMTVAFYPAEGNLGKVEDDGNDEEDNGAAREELEAELEELVGAPVETPAYTWNIETAIDEETGKVTVTITVSGVDAFDLQCIEGTFHYDATVLTLLNESDKENALQCITEPKGSEGEWENMSAVVADGEIRLGAVTFGEATLSDADPMIFTLEFTLAENTTLTGMYIDTAESYGMDVDANIVYGNGGYGVLEIETEESTPESSTPADDSSDDVDAGDAGILVFAILGILAIAGAAVVIKVRN